MPRPSVTSEFVRTPAASPVDAGARVMALIGHGSDKLVIQQAIVKGTADGQDPLAHTATAILKVGNFKGTEDYVMTTDYILTAGKIDWSPANDQPVTGATYYVTYEYAKVTADYAPFLTDSFDEVINRVGPINLTTGDLDVTSYLTAAAQIAFNVGVRQVIICQVETNDTTGFSGAYDKLEQPIETVNPYYIVPLLGSLGTIGDFNTARGTALTHVNKMSSEEFGKERQLYTGLKDYVGSGLGVSDFVALATALGTSRVILAGQYNPLRVIDSSDVELDGTFEAVMLASYRSSQSRASDPMMNKPITGAFSGYATRWGDIDIDNLVDGSVCVTEETAGVIKVVDDITTDNSDEIEIDINTVEARDVLVSTLRNAIYDRYVGARGDNTISSQLKKFTNDYLSGQVGTGLIAAIGAISANRKPGSLREWEIAFSYLPITKVRDIKIRFSVDLGLAA